ncbi:MAG: 4-(cytidine 5'-diphospho)-2-C-methyl-D-erythritol kinase, partial [Chromatiaceae bacterium]
TPVELPEPWYLVMAPACAVSTAAVFADPELTRNSPSIRIADFLAGDDRNDCLGLVRLRYPVVADALDWLGGFSRGRLTGTGACVFATFGSAEDAHAVLNQAPAGLRGYVAKGMNRSLLLRRLAAS